MDSTTFQTQWQKSLDTTSSIEAHGVAVDINNAVYMTGTFFDTLKFSNGGNATTEGAVSVSSPYVVKYDALGVYKWDTVFESEVGSGNDIVASGNFVYVTGFYTGQTSFGAINGLNATVINSNGGSDIFVAKYDATTGAPVWVQTYSNSASAEGLSIDVDATGTILVVGSFQGTLDFGGGALVSPGAQTDKNVFVLRLDTNGNHLWSNTYGGEGDDQATGVAADSKNDFVFIGGFMNQISFDGKFTYDTRGTDTQDVFIAKFSSTHHTVINAASSSVVSVLVLLFAAVVLFF
jgi:hypothetical protein